MWFSNSFRRHLLDMHISDWKDGVFLSEFSPEKYFENLKRANVKSAMIYLQSHVGYCYYPTKTGHIHSAFLDRPDAMKKLIDLCRENGIDVIGYYSINYNTLERDSNPEWAAVMNPKVAEQYHMFSGKRYGICCPNNPDYFDFVLKQIDEMLDYVPMDGIFFDMPFWPYPCYCEHCRKKYREQFGKEIPESREAEDWKEFLYNREKWTDEYIGRITEHVRKQKPHMSVQYNYAYAVLNSLDHFASEVVNEHQDYASGDLYRGFLTQSFACKFYSAVTKNKPFEYMTGRCDPRLSVHTVTKSYDKLRLALMLTAAHHGANFVIDAIDPSGTMDERFYDLLGNLYREVEMYEPYMKTGEMQGDAGLLYIMEGREDGTDEKDSHYNATLAIAKTLIQYHIPYNIVTQATLHDLERFQTLIIANPNGLHEESIEKIKAYVQNGGSLYFSGAEEPKLLKLFLDAERTGKTETANTYIAPQKEYEAVFENFNEKYPLAFENPMPIVKTNACDDVMATIELPYVHKKDKEAFASIHSNPPGVLTDYPAVIRKDFGKGKVLWSAAAIESEKILCYQEIFMNFMELLGVREFSIKTNASRNTEIVMFRAEDQILLSAVYLSEDEKTELQRPFQISVKCQEPKKIFLVRDHLPIDFTYEDGYVTFTTKELNVFDMYQLLL